MVKKRILIKIRYIYFHVLIPPIALKNRSSCPNKVAPLTIIDSGNSSFNCFSPSARDFIILDFESGETKADET
jgi:hypothetical protein